ncbi:hypothetical protein [Micromonospora sp. NPDC005305]|uniref:hypothetical protein n=1 Tax=Micromonospora sp. NPDC005305 TaxID=3156875 RepID=UPI0033AA7974
MDTVLRYSAPSVNGASLLKRGLSTVDEADLTRLDELVERTSSDGVMSGSDWDDLTAYLTTVPGQVITPRAFWRDMAERLLLEMIVADGVGWTQRHEAFNRLLSHPVGQQPAIAACASLAADRSNQVFVEVVSVLDASPHPDASGYVLGQLLNPTNDRAQYGALLASVRKTRYRHFNESQRRQLLSIVEDTLHEDGYLDSHQLAAEVLRQLSAQVPAQARHLPPNVPGTVGPLRRAAHTLVERIVHTALVGMPRELPHFDDRLLPVLLDEMLFSPVLDVRLHAAILLSGSPYRHPLSAALGTELAHQVAGRVHSPDVACAMIEGLRVLGGPAQRPLVERLTVTSGVPPAITVAASQAIAHIAGRSDDRYWRAAIRHHAVRWYQSRDRTPAAALHGLVYGLGQARNTELLRSLRDDHEVPPAVRAAASWWLGLPRPVYEGANR